MVHVDYFKHVDEFVLLESGDVLFDQGDDGAAMYLLREGEIDIFYDDVKVATLDPGRYIGEMALVDGRKRHGRAVARTDAKLIAIDRRRFLFLLQETPTFALQVMKDLAESVERMNEKYVRNQAGS